MTIEEQQALNQMVKDIALEKEKAYDYMTSLMEMGITELATCGYRQGIGTALVDVMKRSKIKINKIISAHLQKYPDAQ